jgi:uncharacterized membrane protein HdeD (DUF308 family)
MKSLLRLIAGLLGLALAVGGIVVAIYAFYSLKNGNSGSWLVGIVGALGTLMGGWLMQRAPRL